MAATKPFAPKPCNMRPIDPVTPGDDRPAICDLLSKHQEAVQAIQASIQSNPLYNPKLHDELWMLRFWLSHNKNSSSKTRAKAVQNAVDAAVETLEFRKKHKLDEADIRRSMWPEWVEDDGPNGEVLMKPSIYNKLAEFNDKYTYLHCQLHPDRGLIGFARIAGTRPPEKMANYPEEEETKMFLTWSEWRFQVLDEVTRRTGRLTKHAIFIDCEGIGWKHMDRKASAREAKLMSLTQNVYPQVNGGFFLLKMPTFMQYFIRLVRPLYPKRLLEKMDVIITESDVNRIYPRFADINTIPKCFRGTHPSWPPPDNGSRFAEEH